MKSSIRFISITLLIALCLMVTGCDKNTPRIETHVAIVFGNRKNNPTPSLDSATSKDKINAAIENGGSISLITVEGIPRAISDYHVAPQTAWISGTTVKKQQEIMRETINGDMMNAAAITPEADTLSAISLGSRSLNVKMNTEEESTDATSKEYILLVFDSGLATTGEIDFTKQLLRSEAEDVVDMLNSRGAIPNLHGIDVVWIGIADVAGDQSSLTPNEVNSLKAIWSKVLESAGANSITFAPDLPSNLTADDTYPEVSEVTFVREFDETNRVISDTPVIFDESSPIKFYADSYKLIDMEKAKEIFKPYADCLINDSSRNILLCGTTATVGSNDSCKKFSYGRSTTIKDLMVQMGVNSSQIQCVGLGYKNEFHVPDINSSGTLNSSAQRNRAVIILDGDCQQAKDMLKTGYVA